jgi:cytochrome P450
VQAVADDMGIPANQAAGNLMLALHLASMPATASLVASMIGELVNRPDLAAKLRAEYDAMRDPAAVKGEPLSQAEVDRATLIEKVMNETGRLHPPVQLTNSVTRQATEELVEGARCPFSKGTRVVAAIFQANRDPARYSKPDDWDIERDYSDALMWNGSEGATNHRDCVGRPIASAIVKTFVLTLFGRWKWTGTEPGLAAWPEKQLAAMRPKKLILKGISER